MKVDVLIDWWGNTEENSEPLSNQCKNKLGMRVFSYWLFKMTRRLEIIFYDSNPIITFITTTYVGCTSNRNNFKSEADCISCCVPWKKIKRKLSEKVCAREKRFIQCLVKMSRKISIASWTRQLTPHRLGNLLQSKFLRLLISLQGRDNSNLIFIARYSTIGVRRKLTVLCLRNVPNKNLL